MAHLIGAVGTAHSPLVSEQPEFWPKHGQFEKEHARVLLDAYGGGEWETLSREKSSWIGKEIAPETMKSRFEAAQKAVAVLKSILFDRMQPDVLVIIGDDQDDVFPHERYMPAIAMYGGATMVNAPRDLSKLPDWWANAAWGHYPVDGPEEYPCEPDLAKHLVTSLISQGFDITFVTDPPEERHVGHAFTFLSRRLMNGRYIPIVPIMLNTYFPPNQPPVARAYELGRALRKAIEGWPADKKVVVAASGGLTHPIVDEKLDRSVLDAIAKKDKAALVGLSENVFRLGTSEIKNWIAVAGAMEESDQRMKLIDYIPAYRTTAGTGCGLAFAEWA